MELPINLNDLLSCRTVESERVEFKAGWNPDAIYRTIAAFANDINNIGGGYIVIGAEDENGRAKRPVKGLDVNELDFIQKQMVGFNNLIRPYYAPKLYIETADTREILVLWITGGNERPYEVPESVTTTHKQWKYFIRRYSSTIEARGKDKQELLSLANRVPFDDRVNTYSSLEDISLTLVRDHLREVKSRLNESAEELPKVSLLAQMDLLAGPPEMLYPKNVALMLFCDYPDKFFPYSYIDVVYFPKGRTEPFTEKQFKGPVQRQIKDALSFIQTIVLLEKVTKVPGRAEADRKWNYPYEALEEIVANSIYHREYQEREPVTIRIEPDQIMVYNLGGPDRSLRMEDFATGHLAPTRYRNRRLGDFLKELDLTEGRATGIAAIIKIMRNNGSPDPVFETDEDRTWFRVTLPIHPDFIQDEDVVEDDLENDLENDLEKRLEKILSLIASEPQISMKTLGKHIGVDSSTIKRDLMKLKADQKIRRIGPAKGGYWKVTDTEQP